MITALLKIILVSEVIAVLGRPFYPPYIPNGDKVTFEGEPWPGVGHFNRAGGGPRNPFGRDVESSRVDGFPDWQAVCNLDSDGDGLTNGEELGDPNCVWTRGSTPEGDPISHPGFADVTKSPTALTVTDSPTVSVTPQPTDDDDDEDEDNSTDSPTFEQGPTDAPTVGQEVTGSPTFSQEITGSPTAAEEPVKEGNQGDDDDDDTERRIFISALFFLCFGYILFLLITFKPLILKT